MNFFGIYIVPLNSEKIKKTLKTAREREREKMIKTLASEVKRARNDQKISRQALCEGLDLSVSSLRRFENGYGGLKLQSLIAIVNAIGLEITLSPKAPRER